MDVARLVANLSEGRSLEECLELGLEVVGGIAVGKKQSAREPVCAVLDYGRTSLMRWPILARDVQESLQRSLDIWKVRQKDMIGQRARRG